MLIKLSFTHCLQLVFVLLQLFSLILLMDIRFVADNVWNRGVNTSGLAKFDTSYGHDVCTCGQ